MVAPPQPDLPHPAHLDRESALGRKFGKEVTNYFGGSPINRVSFLRDDYTFLSGAFSHPSARFLVFKTLSPLIVSPTEIKYVTLDELKPLLTKNPFETSEKEIVAQFDSSIDHPQLVFLGLDEDVKDNVFSYRNFSGAPHWAVDITPKKTFENEANEVNKKFEDAGLKFSEGMRAMSFPANVGEFNPTQALPSTDHF
jgi:NAD+ diphosphatase